MKERGALQAESGGCSFRTAEPPLRTLARRDNFSAYLFFKCRIDDLWLRRLTGLERPGFKDATIGKDDAALDVVLQLSNVAGLAVANQGVHRFLRDGFDCFVHGGSKMSNKVCYKLGNVGFPFA